MRRTITAISLMLFGASILIFISALLIPVRRELISLEGNSKTEASQSSAPLEKTINESALAQTQGPVVISKLESSIPAEGKVEQNQATESITSIQSGGAPNFPSSVAPSDNTIDRNQGEASAKQSSQTVPDATIPRIDEKSPAAVKPMDTKEKRSPQHEPASLLVLEDSFSPGEVMPKADVQEAIDKIIPLINARSPDNVIVEGHADTWIPDGFSPDQGSKWNKSISLQRAKAIALVLKQKGVASDRIVVSGLGDTVPLASNLTNEGRSKNRRVEIKLSPPRD